MTRNNRKRPWYVTPIVISYSRIPKLLSLFISIEAIALGYFVFCRGVASDRLKRHEATHVRQWLELLFVGFAVMYVVFFLIGWAKHRNTFEAYRSIPFEREARAMEWSPMEKVNWFGWLQHLGSGRP